MIGKTSSSIGTFRNDISDVGEAEEMSVTFVGFENLNFKLGTI